MLDVSLSSVAITKLKINSKQPNRTKTKTELKIDLFILSTLIACINTFNCLLEKDFCQNILRKNIVATQEILTKFIVGKYVRGD